MTSIIPVLAQADTLEDSEIEAAKGLISNQLLERGISTFAFNSESSDDSALPIYAVSSKAGDDREVMDASLLMSSEYHPPLIETELKDLVGKLFSVEGGMQLRHSTVTKLLAWRRSARSQHTLTATGNEMIPSRMAGPLVSYRSGREPHPDAARWSKVQLVNWAADLQRSLLHERIASDGRLKRQQALWVREQVKLQSKDANETALASRPGTGRAPNGAPRRRNTFSNDSSWTGAPQQDPLGLLELGTRLKWSGWHAFEVIGSAGLIGGVAVWMMS